MGEYMYLCRQCRALLDLSAKSGSEEEIEAKCPECGSVYIDSFPSWAPVGYNVVEAPLMWEYTCNRCKTPFKLPVPKDPSAEKAIKCPNCGSVGVERLTAIAFELPPYCG